MNHGRKSNWANGLMDITLRQTIRFIHFTLAVLETNPVK